MSNTTINLIYPGSFDPFHRGHADIIRRLHDYFEEPINLIVLLQPNRFKKTSMFDIDFRFNLLEDQIACLFPDKDISVRRTEVKYFSTYWHITNLCSLNYMLVVGDDVLSTIHTWENYPSMVELGLQIVVMQRDLSYNEICKFKDILPIHTIISHDKESVDATYRMSSTKIRNQIMDILNKNLTKE